MQIAGIFQVFVQIFNASLYYCFSTQSSGGPWGLRENKTMDCRGSLGTDLRSTTLYFPCTIIIYTVKEKPLWQSQYAMWRKRPGCTIFILLLPDYFDCAAGCIADWCWATNIDVINVTGTWDIQTNAQHWHHIKKPVKPDHLVPTSLGRHRHSMILQEAWYHPSLTHTLTLTQSCRRLPWSISINYELLLAPARL